MKAAVAFLLVAFAVCLPARGDDWTHLGFDPARGRATPESFSLPGTAVKAWEVLTEETAASPVVADGRVITAGRKGMVRCFRESDGLPLWTYDAKHSLDSTPAVNLGVVYVPTTLGRLIALQLADGGVLWDVKTGGTERSSPVIVGNTLYIGSAFPKRKMLAVNAQTGVTLWETGIDDMVYSSPAVSGGSVVVGSNSTKYYAMDAATGALQWNFSSGGIVMMSSPLVEGGAAYLVPGGASADLISVSLAAGSENWRVTVVDPAPPAPGGFTLQGTNRAVSSPMPAGGRVVFVIRFEYAFDGPDSGSEPDRRDLREFAVGVNLADQTSWQTLIGTYTAPTINEVPQLNLCPTPAAVSGGVLCASSIADALKVISTSTGTELLSYAPGEGMLASPAVANGRAYIVTRGGKLVAFKGTNEPPGAVIAGFVPISGAFYNQAPAALSWSAATDPDDPPSNLRYTVRIDNDGEVLRDWQQEYTTAAGVTTVALPALLDKQIYTWAVRARDDEGAWSGWSAAQKFYVNASPSGGWPISIGGTPYGSVEEAAQAALSGDVIQLGIGTYHLGATLTLRGGVRLQGYAPTLTTLDGSGLGTAIQVQSTPGTVVVEMLTVTGANVGIDANGKDLEVRNVILRNLGTGLLSPSGSTTLAVNVTFAENTAYGAWMGSSTTAVRSSISIRNGVGFSADSGVTPALTYNDAYANVSGNYVGCVPGEGSLSVDVAFHEDWREKPDQAVVDGGDPSDPYDREPQPNGRRVNMGAFGNTMYAATTNAKGVAVPAQRNCSVAASASPSTGPLLPAVLLALGLSIVRRRRIVL